MKMIWLFAFWVGVAVAAWGQRAELVLPEGHSAYITDEKIRPDEKYVATASNDNSVILWSVESGKSL